jgi:hypothetical protein
VASTAAAGILWRVCSATVSGVEVSTRQGRDRGVEGCEHEQVEDEGGEARRIGRGPITRRAEYSPDSECIKCTSAVAEPEVVVVGWLAFAPRPPPWTGRLRLGLFYVA